MRVAERGMGRKQVKGRGEGKDTEGEIVSRKVEKGRGKEQWIEERGEEAFKGKRKREGLEEGKGPPRCKGRREECKGKKN